MIRPPTAAVVSVNGVRSLIITKEPDEQVLERDVQEPKLLARLLMRVLRYIAALARRPCPQRVDYEDLEVLGDGTTPLALYHGFEGRVRWWVVDCDSATKLHCDFGTTTKNTLVLLSELAASNVTIRIEEVGG